MPCAACTLTQQRPHCGAYNFRCTACCARLVISARPNRKAQQAFLHAIARRKENPRQPDILAAIQAHDVASAKPKK